MNSSATNKLVSLIDHVEVAREKFIAACSGLTEMETQFKSTENEWSISDIAEHIVRAEWGGLNGIWSAINGFKNNKPVWLGENVNHGLSIEEIIERTWIPHQPAPEPARPQWGGPVEFWLMHLKNGKAMVTETIKNLSNLDPEKIIYPHPLSGPLDVYQRMEFLRYHMERHLLQVENIKEKWKQHKSVINVNRS